ncbi:MAG: lytic transglycosylase domain-containing protein [Bryobacterales bacterium]|nr:lytic transglycosylase domain-containing protein [Bryobacterales bacterium]MDE0296005.1 lytic transglycosylase domain-containing protein [Bryobacterales bacterium]
MQKAGLRHNVNTDLIHAVIRQESNYDVFAVSVKGACGLMQLMPGTALRFGVKDIFDPAENVEGGVKYLRHLMDRYEGDRIRALAAYNAGEGAVDRYGGVPPYRETEDYVDRVRRWYGSLGGISDEVPEEDHVTLSVDPDGTLVFEMR